MSNYQTVTLLFLSIAITSALFLQPSFGNSFTAAQSKNSDFLDNVSAFETYEITAGQLKLTKQNSSAKIFTKNRTLTSAENRKMHRTTCH